jgi:multidrug efflux pump subunit AcrB
MHASLRRRPLGLSLFELLLVLGILAVLLGVLAFAIVKRRDAGGKLGLAITVETTYPGANAATVADTVAAPIEEQVKGVENALYVVSRSSNDGTYRLTVHFPPGTDMNIAQVLVQNRVALASPVLPEAVNQRGVTVRKVSPGVLLFAVLSSPGGRYDEIYLSNYATIQLKDELSRVGGVGEVSLSAQREYAVRLRIDPEKLAARNLSVMDLVKAITKQNVQVAAGQVGQEPAPGQQFQLTINARGRLTKAEDVANIVIKTGAEGQIVRLKDVATVEIGAGPQQSHASFNGKPAVALVVHLTGQSPPAKVSDALLKVVSRLRERLPDGLDLAVPFDFTANIDSPGQPAPPNYLLLDIDVPAGATAERSRALGRRCEKLVREENGVTDTLALSDNPFDRCPDRPCILIALDKKAERERVVRAIRNQTEKDELSVRVRDLSLPGCLPRGGYPIDLAISGPEQQEVSKLATAVAERLRKDKKLLDVWADPSAMPHPQLHLDIDRAKAKAFGVALDDIFSTLQVCLGGMYVNDFNRFGRSWQVVVQAPRSGDLARDVKKLKVRNSDGKMVPLANLVTVREVEGPQAISRLDGRPMVEMTGNLAEGTSLAEARKLCEAAVEEARKELRLSKEYHLTWLGRR